MLTYLLYWVVLSSTWELSWKPLVCREADGSCKKPMERLLNIWKERALYRADFIQQLKLAIEDSNSPKPAGGWTACFNADFQYSMVIQPLDLVVIVFLVLSLFLEYTNCVEWIGPQNPSEMFHFYPIVMNPRL